MPRRGFRVCTFVGAPALCASLVNAGQALAWGATGHRVIGELASRSLPTDVPKFLRTAEARHLGEVAREPDRSKGAGEPHDANSDPAHYVNVGDDLRIARGPSGSALIVRGPSLSELPANRESYDTVLRANGTNE